jgi:hypothetical protein
MYDELADSDPSLSIGGANQICLEIDMETLENRMRYDFSIKLSTYLTVNTAKRKLVNGTKTLKRRQTHLPNGMKRSSPSLDPRSSHQTI